MRISEIDFMQFLRNSLLKIKYEQGEKKIVPASGKRGKMGDFLRKEEVNLSDFALFLSVMKDKRAHQDVLSIIMNEENLELVEVKVEQVVLNNMGKRAIRLDAWAADTTNRQFTTEMQNDTRKDDVKIVYCSI